MTDEEREVALFPPGCRMQVIIASYTKWALRACSMSAKLRLEFFEGLDSLAGDYLNARALAAVGACTDLSAKMIEEALQADGGEKLSKSWDILTGREVFGALLRLNPSWINAIRLCGYGVKAA